MTHWPRHGRITGPIAMIGFGSIGKGTLPLIERHFEFDPERFVVIDPDDSDRKLLDDRGVRFVHLGLTRDNYRDVLTKYLTGGEGQGFCVNLSVDTSSLDLMRHCREIGALYIDTVVEPWPGFYYDKSLGNEARTNYALRETVLAERRKNPGGTTAVSCCGANPGMVSWFVKQGLVNLARDLGDKAPEPKSKDEWARLAQRLGVKGVHIAERDTQRAKSPKPRNVFVNTWSVEGFLSEGMQPAELGWGSHEKWAPANAGFHKSGCGAAIYINQPGANTRVRSWTPTARAQFGFLVTHNESISIADYYSVRDAKGAAVYRPTCHYAYHPCDDAVLEPARIVRPRRRDPERPPYSWRSRDSRRDRRTGRASLWPRPQRLLVRLAALGRGDARARASSERDRHAGHVSGSRGDGVGAREPEGRHRRGGRTGFPPLPRGSIALSRARRRRLYGLDAAYGSPWPLP